MAASVNAPPIPMEVPRINSRFILLYEESMMKGLCVMDKLGAGVAAKAIHPVTTMGSDDCDVL